ncbi:unnamed protein product [Gongylonema pulchrum]|uniref:Transcription initiation factor TFIID subunit 13 n=1 Tax=Gongylonema pulchrum TaxID=637853 RepID=A0A183DVW4_9BILA|nr:unnamed protein product [Gongylonema pulchrum]
MVDDDSSLFGFDDEDDDEKRKDNHEDKKYVPYDETLEYLEAIVKEYIQGMCRCAVPYDETLEYLEAIVKEYIQGMCRCAVESGKPGKLTLEDIHYLIRRDMKKFGRVKDLLSMSEELKKARKQFDEAKAL